VSAIDEFEAAREDLEALLTEVLGTVAGEEAVPVWDAQIPPGAIVSARLGIHDEEDDSYTVIHVRTSLMVGRMLASRMLVTANPGPEDVVDAIGELGNIVGGNVKSLLRHSCRLSLPTTEVTDEDQAREIPDPAGVTVCAAVLGQVVELTLDAPPDVDGLYWPGSAPRQKSLEARP
jgi:chemotaxis protein CheX